MTNEKLNFQEEWTDVWFWAVPLLPVGTAAMWENKQWRSAEGQSRTLWLLCKESFMFSSHFLLPVPCLRCYWFFVKSDKFLTHNSVHIYFSREKNNNASASYSNKDRSAPLNFTVEGCRSCGSWETAVKINKEDVHAFVCSYTLSKPKWKEEVSAIQVGPEDFFLFLTQEGRLLKHIPG